MSQNTEFTRKLKAAVRAKIEEFGVDADEELPDYVMIMVGNKKSKDRMKADLKLFLGTHTTAFVEWLFGFFERIKNSSNSMLIETLDTKLEPSKILDKQEVQRHAENKEKLSSSSFDNKKKYSEKDKDKSSKSLSLSKAKSVKNELFDERANNKEQSFCHSRSHSPVHYRSSNKHLSDEDCGDHQYKREREKERERKRLSSLSRSKYSKRKKEYSPLRDEQNKDTKLKSRLPTIIARHSPTLRSIIVQPSNSEKHPRIRPRSPSPRSSEIKPLNKIASIKHCSDKPYHESHHEKAVKIESDVEQRLATEKNLIDELETFEKGLVPRILVTAPRRVEKTGDVGRNGAARIFKQALPSTLEKPDKPVKLLKNNQKSGNFGMEIKKDVDDYDDYQYKNESANMEETDEEMENIVNKEENDEEIVIPSSILVPHKSSRPQTSIFQRAIEVTRRQALISVKKKAPKRSLDDDSSGSPKKALIKKDDFITSQGFRLECGINEHEIFGVNSNQNKDEDSKATSRVGQSTSNDQESVSGNHILIVGGDRELRDSRLAKKQLILNPQDLKNYIGKFINSSVTALQKKPKEERWTEENNEGRHFSHNGSKPLDLEKQINNGDELDSSHIISSSKIICENFPSEKQQSELISPGNIVIEVNRQTLEAWDGQIYLSDDESSDDEAEIDAVLEDARKLRQQVPNKSTAESLKSPEMGTETTGNIMPISNSEASGQLTTLNAHNLNSSTVDILKREYPSAVAAFQRTGYPSSTVIIHHHVPQIQPRGGYRAFRGGFHPSVRFPHSSPYRPIIRPRQAAPPVICLPQWAYSKKFVTKTNTTTAPPLNVSIVREKHRQTIQLYAIKLEEERILLQQLQQLKDDIDQKPKSGDIIETPESRKVIMNQIKELRESMHQIKTDIDNMSSQIASAEQPHVLA